jgi:predicted nucleotidyltransferase component of viral defense system
MILQSQISKLSNRLFKEQAGRRIPEAVLERDYCIAWFLVGLSRSTLREKLLFKGGTALKRCYFDNYRFSEDMDFTLTGDLTFEVLKSELELVYSEVKKASGIVFRFSRDDRAPHQNSFTFYLGYEGPLPTMSSGREIKVDVTIKECVVYPAAELAVLRAYAEYDDLPEGATVRVYSLQEIAVEKTVALLDRARTEPRDLFDLWYLTTQSKRVDLSEIQDGIKQKLAFRGKTLDDVRGEFEKKEARLKKTWNTRLSSQMSALPEFDGVYRAVKRELRHAAF